jgi:hypothetical protein
VSPTIFIFFISFSLFLPSLYPNHMGQVPQ